MGLFSFLRASFVNKEEPKEIKRQYIKRDSHEYCPRCDANISLQKGYRNDLSYWICKGCGEMLINPEVEEDSNIVWICDGCGAFLNCQAGFSTDCGEFICSECGFENKIDSTEIYLSEDEFQSDIKNPYKGLRDEDRLALSMYDEISNVNNRDNIFIVKDIESGTRYVKKILSTYDSSVYEYIMRNPVEGMPKIYGVYESRNSLIIIEEYIEGKTLKEIIDRGTVKVSEAYRIIKELCSILERLHNLDKVMIHRDIKPANVIIGDNGKTYLLDINAAKWYKDESEDTRLMGTMYYAAPEQFGYGFSASGIKTDVYSLGILLNVLLTGKYPKEEKAPIPAWNIIEKCISFEPDNRYSVGELIKAIEEIEV